MITDLMTFSPRAALPWITVGLLLAVFFARSARKKKKEGQTVDYGTEGMCLGMCFGTAIGTSLGNNTGIGISISTRDLEMNSFPILRRCRSMNGFVVY